MPRTLFIFLACVTWMISEGQSSISQASWPRVGQRCPDFSLHHIAYSDVQATSLDDLRGKWFILDFWNKYCGTCINSFPKVNAERKAFAGKVQFFLVGIQDPQGKIQSMYKVLQKRENLTVPVVFDSALASRWHIFASPYIILVDDKGIVQAKTADLDSSHLEAFLEGKHPDDLYPVLEDTLNLATPATNVSIKLPQREANPWADDTGLCRSKLYWFSFSNQKQQVPSTIDGISREGSFKAVGVRLNWLYNYAYFGTMNPEGNDDRDTGYGRCRSEPILEVKDSFLFETRHTTKNLLSYSISLPIDRASPGNLMKILQAELSSVFGFNAVIQQRPFPCWKLTATADVREKLKSKGGLGEFKGNYNGSYKMGFSAINVNFHKIFDGLCGNLAHSAILIDDTGIKGNVDLKLDTPLLTITDIKKALSTVGIDVTPTERKMTVLVISDP